MKLSTMLRLAVTKTSNTAEELVATNKVGFVLLTTVMGEPKQSTMEVRRKKPTKTEEQKEMATLLRYLEKQTVAATRFEEQNYGALRKNGIPAEVLEDVVLGLIDEDEE